MSKGLFSFRHKIFWVKNIQNWGKIEFFGVKSVNSIYLWVEKISFQLFSTKFFLKKCFNQSREELLTLEGS